MMFGAIEDVTDDWGNIGWLASYPDQDKLIIYEFALVRTEPIERIDTMLALAQAFAQGAADARYELDIYGVLANSGRADTGGYPVVQVAFRFGTWNTLGDIGKLNAAVDAQVVKAALGKGIAAVKMLRSKEEEARAFSTEGGIAPLFLTRDGKVTTTKAAVNPSARQILHGDIRNLSAATPFTGPGPIQPSAPVEEDTMSWGTIALVAGVVALGTLTYLGIKGQRAINARMTPNGPRRRRPRKQKAGRRKIGTVGVDSGMVWIGDPAYLGSRDTGFKKAHKDLMSGKVHGPTAFKFKMGHAGLGVATTTGFGDGSYPVMATYDRDGRVSKVEIEFIKGRRR
jgi:hypothetical protein